MSDDLVASRVRPDKFEDGHERMGIRRCEERRCRYGHITVEGVHPPPIYCIGSAC